MVVWAKADSLTGRINIMARRPFYGQGGAIPIAKMNMQAATAPGRAYAQMGKDFGDKIGSAIKQYGLNKVKREKLIGEIEAHYEQNKNALTQIGMSGDEAQDKKDLSQRDKFIKGDMSMAELEGYAGKLARGDVLKTKAAENESRRIANEMGALNLSITEELKDTRIGIERDKGEISRLARQLAVETNPQKRKLIQAQFTDAIANLGLGDMRRKLERKETESKLSLVDPQTDATRSALIASELKSDTESADILGQGGPGGAAQQLQEDRDLARQDKQSQIDFRNNAGLAQIYKSLAQKNPTFAEQFNPLAALQDKLRGLTVKTPKGESVSYAEYEKLHNDDPDLYPMNNEPGAIKAQIESVNSQIYNLSRDQTVQVNVPDEINEQSEQVQPPVPAYKKALDDQYKQIQQEYMNQPEVGGMGFPFMP